MGGEAGRDKPSCVIKDHGKEALHREAQKGVETADKDSDGEDKGQEQSGREVMRRGGPPERRGEQETEAHGYRGSPGTRTQIMYVEKENTTEGSQKRRRSPHGRQAKDRTNGKATQRLFQHKPVAPPRRKA